MRTKVRRKPALNKKKLEKNKPRSSPRSPPAPRAPRPARAQSPQCVRGGRRKQKHRGSSGGEITTITERGQGAGSGEQGTKPLEAALMSTGSESALPPRGP